jgi:hypothetical protein
MSARPPFLLAALAVSLGAPLTAHAHDHHPPTATLRIEGQVQKGKAWAFSWQSAAGKRRPVTRSGPEFCATLNADGRPVPMDPLIVGAGEHELQFEFHKRQPPDRITIFAFSGIEGGVLTGDATEVEFDLEERRVNGRRWWIASTLLPINSSTYFDVFGSWKDTEGCGGPQDVSWTFHAAP